MQHFLYIIHLLVIWSLGGVLNHALSLETIDPVMAPTIQTTTQVPVSEKVEFEQKLLQEAPAAHNQEAIKAKEETENVIPKSVVQSGSPQIDDIDFLVEKFGFFMIMPDYVPPQHFFHALPLELYIMLREYFGVSDKLRFRVVDIYCFCLETFECQRVNKKEGYLPWFPERSGKPTEENWKNFNPGQWLKSKGPGLSPNGLRVFNSKLHILLGLYANIKKWGGSSADRIRFQKAYNQVTVAPFLSPYSLPKIYSYLLYNDIISILNPITLNSTIPATFARGFTRLYSSYSWRNVLANLAAVASRKDTELANELALYLHSLTFAYTTPPSILEDMQELYNTARLTCRLFDATNPHLLQLKKKVDFSEGAESAKDWAEIVKLDPALILKQLKAAYLALSKSQHDREFILVGENLFNIVNELGLKISDSNYNQLGLAYKRVGNFSQAAINFENAAVAAVNVLNASSAGLYYENAAVCREKLGQHMLAAQNFAYAYLWFRHARNFVMAIANSDRAAQAYKRVGEYKKSAHYFAMVINIKQKAGQTLTVADYDKLAHVADQAGEFETAISNDLKAAEIYSNSGNLTELARCYGNVAWGMYNLHRYADRYRYDAKAADVYAKLGQYDRALKLYGKAIDGFEALGFEDDTDECSHIYKSIDEILQSQSSPSPAQMSVSNMQSARITTLVP